MTLRMKSNQYRFEERKYFNTAAGIRATDRNHLVAQRYFERMKSLETEKGGIKTLAQEGFETAERVRALVAQMLGCKPRNIVFGNSASLLAMLAIRVLMEHYGKDKLKLVYHSDYQYPAVISSFTSSKTEIKEVITRQNYAYAPNCHEVLTLDSILDYSTYEKMRLTNAVKCDLSSPYMRADWEHLNKHKQDELVSAYKTALRSLLENGVIKMSEANTIVSWLHDELDGFLFLKVIDRVHRFMGCVLDISKAHKGPLDSPTLDSNLLIDGSHSFGVMDFNSKDWEVPSAYKSPFQPIDSCSFYIANSSKALGAEPTIGIMYVADSVLELFSSFIPSIHPKVAFQFSPDLECGVTADEIPATKYWLSLPELYSLNAALDSLFSFGLRESVEHLSEIRSKLLRGIDTLRLRQRIWTAFEGGILRYSLTPEDDFGKEGYEESVFHRRQFNAESRYVKRLNRAIKDEQYLSTDMIEEREYGDYLSNLISIRRTFLANGQLIAPNYLTLEIEDFDSILVKDRLAELGYAVDSFQEIPITKQSKFRNRHIRISFRYGVDYDIDGFLEALESVLKEMGAKK